MERFSKDADYHAGIELMRQEFLADVSTMKADPVLNQAQKHFMYKDLAHGHELCCTQEWKAISAQMLADQAVTVAW
jgi:hypothetical protein